MDLNPAQLKLAFAVIVVILAGLGVYILLPSTNAAPTAATPAPTPSVSPVVSATAPQPQPAGTPAPQPGTGADIYRWLPFTQSDLATAASAATQAAGYYGTFSYTESAAAYAARMTNVVTSQYLHVLESDFATYGVAQQRKSSKQISTATAVVTSLRAFDTSSLTFVVTISQRIQQVSGSTSPTGQYAITVVNTGGTWQVDQIQPASAGNH
jgi:hypothetical protein